MCERQNLDEIVFEMYETNKANFESYLCQGDIIIDYPKDKLATFKPVEFFKGILILSYTCDLKNNKLDYINYCPIFNMKHLITEFLELLANDEKISHEVRKRKLEDNNPYSFIREKVLNKLHDILNYKDQNIFYLEPNDIFNHDRCYAYIGQIFTIPIEESKELKKNCKASLLSPYIEKLGYMVGNCFNRVALDEFEGHRRNQIYEKNYRTLSEEIVNKILKK